MSKIKDLLNNKNSVLVFDIDGVLAVLEFGEYHHHLSNDDEWNRLNNSGNIFYNQDKVSNKIKEFLSKKEMGRIYVITTVGNDKEGEFKKEFAHKYYNIPKENVYCVEDNGKKIKELKNIKSKYPELDDYLIIMIDDTVNILNDIMEKTNFSTAHISSFIDI